VVLFKSFSRLSQVENALKGQKHIAQGSALGIDTDRNYALDSELARLSTYWSARRATEQQAKDSAAPTGRDYTPH